MFRIIELNTQTPKLQLVCDFCHKPIKDLEDGLLQVYPPFDGANESDDITALHRKCLPKFLIRGYDSKAYHRQAWVKLLDATLNNK